MTPARKVLRHIPVTFVSTVAVLAIMFVVGVPTGDVVPTVGGTAHADDYTQCVEEQMELGGGAGAVSAGACAADGNSCLLGHVGVVAGGALSKVGGVTPAGWLGFAIAVMSGYHVANNCY